MAAPNAQMLEDLKKLFALKDRFGASYNKGQLIYFQGSPADNFNVILKGRVEVTRPGAAPEILGPGELFGEVEIFTGHARIGKATAVEDCTTLAFNRDTAVTLAETAPHFVVAIIQKCCERVLQAEQASEGRPVAVPAVAKTVAAPTQQPAAASAPTEAPPPAAKLPSSEPETIGPVVDVDYKPALWKKEVVCPNCKTKFGMWNVRSNFINVDTRDSDFMSRYVGVNPNLYAVWVCPNCQLAAYVDDFLGIQSAELGRIKPALEAIKSEDPRKYDFGYFRDADLALRSFQLALATYEGKRGGEDKVAGLYHRMAWTERERGNVEEEKKYLTKARDAYEKAFSTLDNAKQGVVWAYLVAELNLRLRDFASAVKWFSTASQQPEFKAQPMIEKMTRDRWSEAGDLAKAAKAEAAAS